MSCYFLAVVNKRDAATFARYQEATVPLVAPLRVKIHAVTEDVIAQEGDFNATTLVLLEFASKSEFSKWWDSEEYRAVKPLRFASADTRFAVTFGDDA
jgi:uncharacterized protein (DUF1330 family)